MNSEIIRNLVKRTTPKRRVLKNTIQAFIVGGIICVIAQVINDILLNYLDKDTSKTVTTISMIILASIFTACGVYDKIGQFAGAGTIVPITGFANSVTSSAMEFKSEGFVIGVINNMLKLAGSVIVTGVISAFFVGSLIYLFGL